MYSRSSADFSVPRNAPRVFAQPNSNSFSQNAGGGRVSRGVGSTSSEMADTLQFELDINDQGAPTVEQVLEYRCPTAGYMCPLTANTYGLDFLSFRIRDYATSKQLFEVARDPDAPPVDISQIPPEMEDQVRCISYDFGADFLNLETIGTTLEFSVGPREVEGFRMIERHYFRDTLIKSYDFMFGFCIPNSTNTWEAIYDMPELPEDLQQAMIDNPWETESDSFYFVGDTMIMHNKVRHPNLPPLHPRPSPPPCASAPAPRPTRPPTRADRPSTPTQDREGARRGLGAANRDGVIFAMHTRSTVVACLRLRARVCVLSLSAVEIVWAVCSLCARDFALSPKQIRNVPP